MKLRTLAMFVLLVFSGLAVAQKSGSTEESNALNAECTFTPKYIWRGITYTDGLAIQPSITFTQNKFSVQFWSNLVAKDTSSTPVNEMDIYITYNYNLLGFTITPSFFYYSYPGQDISSTGELSLALSYSFGKFTVGSSVAQDIMEVSHSFFGTCDIEYSTELTNNLSLDASGGIGWGNKRFNEYYIGLLKGAVNYAKVSGSLNYALSKNFTIRPYIENYYTLDSDIKNLLGSNAFNFGIAVGVEL